MNPTEIASLALTIVVLGTCLYTDLRHGKILNKVTLPCVPIGLLIWGVGAGWGGLLFSVEGAALGSVALLIAGALRWIAPGDAKLIVAVGALNGATFVLYTAGFGAIAGGIIAIAILLKRRLVKAWVTQTAVAISSHLPVQTLWANRAGYIPYSIAIATGALAATLYLWGS